MRSSGAHQSPRARAFRLGRQSFCFDSKLAMRDMPAGYQTSLRVCKSCCILAWTVHITMGLIGVRRPFDHPPNRPVASAVP